MSCCRAAGVHVFCVGLCVKVGNLEEIPSACSKYETIIMKCRQSFILTPLCLMLWITKNIVKGIAYSPLEPSLYFHFQIFIVIYYFWTLSIKSILPSMKINDLEKDQFGKEIS